MIHNVLVKSLCAIALLWACASDNQNVGNAQNAPQRSGSGAGTSNPPDRSKSMTGITAAYTAFRAYAAQKLGIAANKVEGGPNDEALGKLMKTRVGSVWAFIMNKPGDHSNEVRGWATEDGKVVTLEQNLGALFAEAGVWGGGVSPALTEREIADRLTWSLGTRYSVYVAPHLNVPGPTLALKDGAGTFTFTANYHEPGPGGAGGGPPQLTRIEIALTADRRATATQKRISSP
jgi:hypothetical protein